MRAQVIEKLVTAYISENASVKKSIIEQLSEIEAAEKEIYNMIFSANQRAALRLLCDLSKKKKFKEALKPLVIKDADKLLSIPDDKARKNACALIGNCAAEQCADKLAAALKNEKTRFVRPSIILALGNTSEPNKYLKGFCIEPGEEKHMREEAEALKKALAPGIKRTEKISFILPEWCSVTYINAKALAEELTARGRAFKKSAFIDFAYDIKSKDMEGLRCYLDALFFIGSTDNFAESAKRLNDLGCRGLNYRIETKHIKPEYRSRTIRLVSDGLSKYGYSDSPSSYSFEIRVSGYDMFAVFPDGRFSYRKQSVPASINPVTAASIMRLCYPYFTDNARVLDPFCGSGTMLIERGMIKKTDALVGVDISPKAIEAANENKKHSGLKVSLIKADILDYKAVRYDEIISNMPFGLRVSGHKSNIRLYHDFARKMDSLLHSGGRAFLFTQEKSLIKEAVYNVENIKIIDEVKIETGGLYPALFIIEKKREKWFVIDGTGRKKVDNTELNN